MASFTDHEPSARPPAVHRHSSTTNPLTVPPGRHGGARGHAHSVSLGNWNTAHRVTRRKSMTSNNFSALAAKGLDGAFLDALAASDRKPPGRPSEVVGGARPFEAGSSSILRPANATPHASAFTNSELASAAVRPEGPAPARGEQAVFDSRPLSASVGANGGAKPRNRRASDGGHLTKTDGKRVSGAELRCEKCGKGYKHSSCLTKHLWEHTPEWSYTSKLLISKHQQVQLLEAATVLVGMNRDAAPPGGEHSSSDQSSASPLPSGSSAIASDELSSSETTPPPSTGLDSRAEFDGPPAASAHGYRDPAAASRARNRRSTAASSLYSPASYASPPGPGSLASSIPTSSAHGSFPAGGGFAGGAHHRRPSTAASSAYGGPGLLEEDEAGLAAAVELCHFGTPRTAPVAGAGADIPPVPPLPAQYQGHHARASMGGLPAPKATPWTGRVSDERDVTMRDRGEGRGDEDDDGVFGRMEE